MTITPQLFYNLLRQFSQINVSNDVTGILPVANGGSGLSIGSPYAQIALTGSNQSLSTTIAAKVLLNSVIADSQGWWDNTNNRYTPQLAGKYLVSVGIGVNPTGGNLTASSGYIYQNGSPLFHIVNNTSTSFGGSYGSAIVQMNGSTDYIEEWASANFPGTAVVEAIAAGTYFTWMSILYIGP